MLTHLFDTARGDQRGKGLGRGGRQSARCWSSCSQLWMLWIVALIGHIYIGHIYIGHIYIGHIFVIFLIRYPLVPCVSSVHACTTHFCDGEVWDHCICCQDYHAKKHSSWCSLMPFVKSFIQSLRMVQERRQRCIQRQKHGTQTIRLHSSAFDCLKCLNS